MKCGTIHRDGDIIVSRAWLAHRPWSRLRGLLARPPLGTTPLQALWLRPCGSIHTFGMRYPLDVVFLSREGRVLGWRENVAPWRACAHRGAFQTVELARGALATLAPKEDETWSWHPH